MSLRTLQHAKGYITNPKKFLLYELLRFWLSTDNTPDLAKVFCIHDHMAPLQQSDQVMAAFAFHCVYSMWLRRLNEIDALIASFENINIDNPGDDTMRRAQQFRLVIRDLRVVSAEFECSRSWIERSGHFPIQHLPDLQLNQDTSNTFLETLSEMFQLVIGGIQSRDNRESRQEAQRTNFLSLCAAVYAPVSLATAIFSMNIDATNGSPLSWR
jgi:hypothetical protein